MPEVSFAKYEGLGNDFIVLDGAGSWLHGERVRQLCDRHYGIGADGILIVSRSEHVDTAAKMVVLNADGSRPEMCGNGLRCVALHVARREGVARADLIIETDSGQLRCSVDRGRESTRDPDAGDVSIEMGQALFHGTATVAVGAASHPFDRWSIGNPHAITFAPYTTSQIRQIGPVIATDPSFQEGTNVEFATLRQDGGIDLVVWERGVGLTLACGSGACATAAAACAQGKRPYGEFFEVTLPGGSLHILVEAGSGSTTMRGPARRVFVGEVRIP